MTVKECIEKHLGLWHVPGVVAVAPGNDGATILVFGSGPNWADDLPTEVDGFGVRYLGTNGVLPDQP